MSESERPTSAAAAPAPAPITVDELRPLEVFRGLPDGLLTWLVNNGETVALAKEQSIFEPGQPGDRMIIVVRGAVHLQLLVGTQLFAAYTYQAGHVTGMLPYSRMTTFMGRGVAAEADTRLLIVHKDQFDDMLRLSQEFGRRLVGILSDRVREATRNAQQREKMTALGTLAAGLAHELNNPAAAVHRAGDALGERLCTLPELTARVVGHGLTTAQFDTARAVRDRAFARGPARTLTTVERGRAENAVGAWLEAHGATEAWVLAETYVDAGLDIADLETLAAAMPEGAAADVLAWVEGMLAAERLSVDITGAAARISDLVGAVKSYSHMDRAQDKQVIDLRTGLDSTITMLGHKLKVKHVTIDRTYDPALPQVAVYPGEINQVWTNLLDNAIDAVADGGHVGVEVTSESGNIVVRIIDDGHGIRDDIQSRIFEPFFTTKPVGLGTGLGLDIVQRIVTQHHGGHIGVASKPGETVFTVRLPLSNGRV
jgi:signal transduction histidine kinase